MPSVRSLIAAGLPLLFAASASAQVCNQNGCCDGLIIAKTTCCSGDPNIGVNDPQATCTAGTTTTLSPDTDGPASASTSDSSMITSSPSSNGTESTSESGGGQTIGAVTGNGGGGVAINCINGVCTTITGDGSGFTSSVGFSTAAGSGETGSGASAQATSSTHNGAMATFMPAAYLGLGVAAAAYGAM